MPRVGVFAIESSLAAGALPLIKLVYWAPTPLITAPIANNPANIYFLYIFSYSFLMI